VPSYGDNPRPACEAVRAPGWPPERTGIHGDARSKPDRLVPTSFAEKLTFRFAPLLDSRQRYAVAEMPKGTIATGQQNDLHSRGSIGQDLGHQIKAGVVRIDERIVQDQRHRHTLLE
jgi:hypothetical protein